MEHIVQQAADTITHIQWDLLTQRLIQAIRELRPPSESTWSKVGIPFGSAFGGSLFAFFLSWLWATRKSDDERNAAINEAAIVLSTNIEILSNFTAQFLDAFSQEIRIIGHHASQYGVKISDAELALLKREWETRLFPVIRALAARYSEDPMLGGLNGLIKRNWESPKFTHLDVQKLAFANDGMPLVARLAIYSNSKLKTFTETLEDRHRIWLGAEHVISGDELWEASPKFMVRLFELINARETLRVHANDALVLMTACAILLEAFQNERFPELGPKEKKFAKKYSWWFRRYFPRLRIRLVGPSLKVLPQPVESGGDVMIGAYSDKMFGDSFAIIRSRWPAPITPTER